MQILNGNNDKLYREFIKWHLQGNVEYKELSYDYIDPINFSDELSLLPSTGLTNSACVYKNQCDGCGARAK